MEAMTATSPAIRPALDAHVVGRRKTGNETYVVNLATALARRPDVQPLAYVDAGVVWPLPDGPETRELSWRSSFLRIPVELPTRARQDHCDLLHVQYVAPPIARLPLVTAIHDVSFEDVPGLFPRRTELRLKVTVRLSARRSQAVITISEFTRGRIAHHYHMDPDRIVVTPLGVGEQWRPLPKEEALAKLAGLSLPASFVLAVGNLHPRKNIPRLVKAVAAARRAGAGDLHLVLAGQRWWRMGEIAQAIEEESAIDWVHFLGYVDDDSLVALYSAADVVAYPSLYEGFGLPVLEALACGAVVVASNASAIPEVAGEAAILVDPHDDAAIAEAISIAATDDNTRSNLRRAARIQSARFTWERCADLTVGAYRTALAAGR
jgi:glycosyltransferase involved in cell wall biosynthesis